MCGTSGMESGGWIGAGCPIEPPSARLESVTKGVRVSPSERSVTLSRARCTAFLQAAEQYRACRDTPMDRPHLGLAHISERASSEGAAEISKTSARLMDIIPLRL